MSSFSWRKSDIPMQSKFPAFSVSYQSFMYSHWLLLWIHCKYVYLNLFFFHFLIVWYCANVVTVLGNIIFSNKVLNNSPPLLFNESFIELVNSHKHLGLYFSSTLNWSKQIFEVCLKANRKLAMLKAMEEFMFHIYHGRFTRTICKPISTLPRLHIT